MLSGGKKGKKIELLFACSKGSSLSKPGSIILTPSYNTKNFLTFPKKNVVHSNRQTTSNYTGQYVGLSWLAIEIDEQQTGGGVG